MSPVKIQEMLLVGDSMVEFFDWQGKFPENQVHNLGRSGESVEELRIRAQQIVDSFKTTDLLLVMIGTNNVAMENFTFLPAYEDILETFQEAYPEAVIVVNSLLPMELNYLAPDTVPRVNSSLKSMAASSGALYLDGWRVLVDKTGKPLEDVLEDGVHLTPHGYDLWSAELGRLLANYSV